MLFQGVWGLGKPSITCQAKVRTTEVLRYLWGWLTNWSGKELSLNLAPADPFYAEADGKQGSGGPEKASQQNTGHKCLWPFNGWCTEEPLLLQLVDSVLLLKCRRTVLWLEQFPQMTQRVHSLTGQRTVTPKNGVRSRGPPVGMDGFHRFVTRESRWARAGPTFSFKTFSSYY